MQAASLPSSLQAVAMAAGGAVKEDKDERQRHMRANPAPSSDTKM